MNSEEIISIACGLRKLADFLESRQCFTGETKIYGHAEIECKDRSELVSMSQQLGIGNSDRDGMPCRNPTFVEFSKSLVPPMHSVEGNFAWSSYGVTVNLKIRGEKVGKLLRRRVSEKYYEVPTDILAEPAEGI